MTADPELRDFVERVAEFVQYWGFKRIHGRIWAHLYLSKSSLDARELIQRLKVSKALISISIADLIKYGVVREDGESSRGTQLYCANFDVPGVIVNVLKIRERKMLESVNEAHRLLAVKNGGPDSVLDPDRLKAMGQMIHLAEGALEAVMELSSVDLEPWRELRPNESQPN